jgi:hypothetical protein
MILFGWYRFVCKNGLVIGETMIEIKERHSEALDLAEIPKRIRTALRPIEADRARMKKWQAQKVAIGDIATWVDGAVSKDWGKKAAARVFHICESGKDIELENFAPGSATEKPIRYRERVPGSPERAATKYDVSQALSFVATRRNNAEERVVWQGAIPGLLNKLSASV